MTRIMKLFLAVTVFLAAGLAHAADPFTVVGVPVDAIGETAIDAQIAATEKGQTRAAELLIERLTLDSARAGANIPPMTIETARTLIRGQQIGNEKRSANRYLGDISVGFNPTRVKEYIEGFGLSMITTQARPRLIIPILNGESADADNEWTQVWEQGSHRHALTPILSNTQAAALVSSQDAVSGNIDAIKSAAAAAGVSQVLVARAVGSEGNYQINLTDYATDTGVNKNMGAVSAFSAYEGARRAVDGLERSWKEASANTAANAQAMIMSILFNSHDDWISLQDAINTSAQITDARLDALTKDGAMMTLTVGDLGRLANELSYKGVKIETDPKIGTYLARNNYRR